MMSAIQNDRATAAVLAVTCKTAYSWVVPVLYSTVVLEKARQVVTFEATLRRSQSQAGSGEGKASHRSLLARPLGTYVRHLWLGPTRVQHCCTVEASPEPISTTAPWILLFCPSLSSVAFQECAMAFHLRHLVDCLPRRLRSLCIFPCASSMRRDDLMRLHFDVPNICRLTALHDLTVVGRILSARTVQVLAGMPSVCGGGVTQILKFPNRLAAGALLSADGQNFAYALHGIRGAVLRHRPGSPGALRMANVFVVNHAQACVKDISLRVQRTVLAKIDTSSPEWEWPPHIIVCVKDGCVEGDELEILYDDWLARCNPSAPCCIVFRPRKARVSPCIESSPAHP